MREKVSVGKKGEKLGFCDKNQENRNLGNSFNIFILF